MVDVTKLEAEKTKVTVRHAGGVATPDGATSWTGTYLGPGPDGQLRVRPDHVITVALANATDVDLL